MSRPRRIAVIGSGVAGLTAAHVAARTAHVTLYEADSRLGGHADTHDVGGLAIDTGFIVHNERTYPTLLRLFAEVGVATQPSEMSMSVRDEATGLEYAGALGAARAVPHAAATCAVPGSSGCWARCRASTAGPRALLDAAAGASDDQTLRDFLAEGGFSAYFCRQFMEPLVAAVWSCDPEVALDYPARYLFEFLAHHGMLSVTGSPQWRTVVGGSREYVARVAAGLDEVRVGTKVTSVRETADAVEVTDGNGATTSYDAVVVATHPDQALAMLAGADGGPARGAGGDPVRRQPRAAAHRHLPAPACRARPGVVELPAAPRGDRGAVTVTYDLTRLQRLPTEDPLPGHPRRRGPRGPAHGDRAHGVRPPDVQPRRPSPPSGACPRPTPRGSPSPAPTTAGASTRTARAPAPPPPSTSACRGTARRCPSPGCTTRRSGTPAAGPFRRPFEHRAARLAGRPRRAARPRPARPLRGPRPPRLTRRHDPRERRRLPGRARHRPRRRPGADGRERARLRQLLQPDQRLLVLRPQRRPGRARSSRSTTPTAAGTPTSSTPTSTAGRASTSSSTSRRSTAPTAGTTSWCRCPGDDLLVAITLHTDDGATFSASLAGPAYRRPRRGGRHRRHSGARP